MQKHLRAKVTAIILGALAATPVMADEFLSVCDRPAGYRLFLEDTFSKFCRDITAADLATVKRVDVEESGLSFFRTRDVADLPNLEILNLNGNPFTKLPPQAFGLLPKLKTLVIIRTGLASLPEDFIAGNSELENLIMYKNKFTTIPQAVLERIQALPALKEIEMSVDLEQAQKDSLTATFPAGGHVKLSFR